MKKTILITLLFLCVLSSAQNPANIDASFSTEGWFGLAGTVKKIAHKANGKIMVCGTISFYKGTPVNNIFCLNPDGSLDTSFNPGQTFSVSANTFAIQPDGKVIVAGYSETSFGIKRLNEDGSVDTSFNVSFNYPAQSFAIQPDGKVLVGGDTNTFLDKIIRLNANGTLDSSFDSNATITIARCIIVESGGKIIVGGEPTAVFDAPSLIRLNPGGSVDTTFSSAVFSSINTLYKQADGKIIIGGNLRFGSSLGDAHNVARIMSDGQLDPSFEPGDVNSSEVYASAVRQDGKVLIGGRFTEYNQTSTNNIVCLNQDGSIDAAFDSGIGFNHHIYALEAHSGNTFFAGGDYTYYNTTNADSIVLINSDGNADTSFDTGRIVDTQTSLNALCPQADGKIIVGGIFNHYDNVITNRLVRFNSDGSKDLSFNIGSGFTNGVDYATVRTIAKQPDGKIIVGGEFTDYNGTAVTNLVRLNTDASVDPTFINGNSVNLSYGIEKILIQPDGKILVIGSGLSSWNSGKVVRLNSDGSLDSSFNIPVLNSVAEAIVLQPDGKIIVGGHFSTCNTLTAKGIVRLNTDGTIDNSLITGAGFDTTGSGYVRCLALQADGKILVGGWLRSYNGVTTIRYIVRLNTNGTIDPLFNFGTGFNSSVASIALDANNKILVGGTFTAYNGINNNRIIRLNADGTADSQFNVGIGFTDTSNISILPDGKIMAYGGFSSYNGSVAKQVIRLNGNAVLGTQNNTVDHKLSLYSNPVKDVLQLKLDDFMVVKSYTIFNSLGKEIKSEATFNDKINVMNLPKGIYILKVETNLGQFTDKFIKE